MKARFYFEKPSKLYYEVPSCFATMQCITSLLQYKCIAKVERKVQSFGQCFKKKK